MERCLICIIDENVFLFFSISLFLIFLRSIENTVEINSIKEKIEKLIAQINELVGKMSKKDLQKKFEETKTFFADLSISDELDELIPENGDKAFWKRFKIKIKSSKYVFLIKTILFKS
jgi:hypothetical protein